MGLDKDCIEKGTLEEKVFTYKPFGDSDVDIEITHCGICRQCDNTEGYPIPTLKHPMSVFSVVDGARQSIPSVSATRLP